MLHLCIDARLYHASGIGTLLKAALTYLTALASFRITLLCHEKDRFHLASLGHTLIPMKSPIYSVQEQWEYPKVVPACDLFWAPHFNVPLLPIRAQKRLVTVCDVYHLAYFSSLSWKEKLYAKVMYQAAFSRSDLVTTISHFSAREIEKFAIRKPKNLKIIYPGLDHFNPKVEISNSRSHLLFVGNLKPHKNLLRLIQAYDRLQPEEPLLIVGKKEGLLNYDSSLAQVVAQSLFLKEKVIFKGRVEDQELHELYARAKVFLFPSLYEGFGYPPLEAMAYECPVLTSRAAAIPEVCGEAVEYVDPYSIDSIANGLKRLLTDSKRREELIQKGKAHFAWKKEEKNLIGDAIDACCRCA